MPMYNLIEYGKNYRKTTGTLRNYYRDEPNSGAEGDTKYSIKESESSDYKTSITGKLESNKRRKDAETVVLLKYSNNFWRTLDIPLINFEVSLTLTWFKNCEITSKSKRDTDSAADPPLSEINNPTSAIFKSKDTKLHVPVVTLSVQDDNKLLEQLKTGFKRTIKWNKYTSEITNQIKTDNLNYLIDPTFTKLNRLFIMSFKNEED